MDTNTFLAIRAKQEYERYEWMIGRGPHPHGASGKYDAIDDQSYFLPVQNWMITDPYQ